ncbi:hypothetical protein BHE74_00029946 [Ensete ventricosum]|nr:hypothetical protein BHE74_00029946 [Ensete ventricosum]RZR95618.1 hypothetical protein BHM03_00024479 [Ensete ventricosum]
MPYRPRPPPCSSSSSSLAVSSIAGACNAAFDLGTTKGHRARYRKWTSQEESRAQERPRERGEGNMGCSLSGLNALYDAVSGGGDVWINENRFRIVRQLGEGGFAFVFLVKEVVADGLARKKSIDPSHISGPARPRFSRLALCTNILPSVYIQICSGLKHMHSFDPPYAHNDVKPGNVLITHRKGQPPLAILMDFGSARPARKEIRSRSEALQLQEWASEHCSAPFRAPELWDCPSHADIDERTDIWSLGCTLYAIM